MTKIERKKLREYWLNSSVEDWDAYLRLRKAKKYAHALFFMHLTIEKIIKAIIVMETGEHAPYSHNLSYLLGKTSLEAPEHYIDILAEMSKFNMQTRYPDEKLAFYSTVTADVSLKWHKLAMEVRQWLLNSLSEN